MIADRVFANFLQKQYEEALALADASDRLELIPLGANHGPPSRYVARYLCPTLIQAANGEVLQVEEFTVGICFPSDFLREVNPLRIVQWLHPEQCWHPNVQFPFLCLGRIEPGLPLVDILYQVFEIGTYRNYATHDGLNAAACQWARNHQSRFPLDTRPLKRRTREFQCESASRERGA